MASTASTAATLLPRPVGGASYLSSSSSASSHRRCLLGVRYARRLLAPHWTDGCPSDARPLASAACTICQSTIVDMQQEPKAKRSLLDNSTNLISGGSLRNMPDVEGSVIDLFGKPLFFSLYDWFLEMYNLHISPYFWDRPNKFELERFSVPKKDEGIEGWAGFDPVRA